MRTLSLRSRLLAGLTIVAVMFIAVAFAVTTTTKRHLIAQVDDQLLSASEVGANIRFALDGGYREQPPEPTGDLELPDLELPDLEPGGHSEANGWQRTERLSSMYEAGAVDGVLTVIFNSNLPGQQLSSPAINVETLPDQHDIFTVDAVEGDTRYRVSVDGRDGAYLVRALPLYNVDATVQRMINLQALGLAAILTLLGAVAWWVIRLGIRPIQEMTTTARSIAVGDLGLRLQEPDSPGTEAGELATTLNAMLGRIEGAVQDQTRSEDRLRRFVADASHELRTPVTTIRGYAELYRHGGLRDSENLDDAMRRTEQEALRMGRLVEDMLELAKLDQERPIQRETIDVSRLANDAVLDAAATDPDRTINSAIDNDVTVIGDSDRLRQVLANIIGNAMVHTPAGSPITVAVSTNSSQATITITDEGEGMDKEVASRITERFFRADPSRSRERGGSGLGMSITQAIVLAHGGEISVDSTLGQGTSIRITLPVYPSQDLA